MLPKQTKKENCYITLVCMQSMSQRYNYIQSYQNLQNRRTIRRQFVVVIADKSTTKLESEAS